MAVNGQKCKCFLAENGAPLADNGQKMAGTFEAFRGVAGYHLSYTKEQTPYPPHAQGRGR